MSSRRLGGRGRPRVAGPVFLLAMLLLAGCRAGAPAQELEDAVAATVAGAFRFDLTARADRAALDGLGAGAAEAAAFLEGFVVEGRRGADGLTHIGLSIGGTAPLLEAVVVPEGELLLRTGLGQLLGIEDADPERELGPALDEVGVSPEGRAALLASFGGGWIAVTGLDGLGALLDEAAEEGEAVAGDLEQLLAATTVTGARDAGDVRRLDVEVETAVFGDLLGDPAETGEVLPGTVVLRDGVVTEVRLDLSAGSESGSVELVVTLSDHGRDPGLERPEPQASLTRSQLLELLGQLQDATLPVG